jgi:hypothetical protein
MQEEVFFKHLFPYTPKGNGYQLLVAVLIFYELFRSISLPSDKISDIIKKRV